MTPQQQPPKRRRIAGEAKPGQVQGPTPDLDDPDLDDVVEEPVEKPVEESRPKSKLPKRTKKPKPAPATETEPDDSRADVAEPEADGPDVSEPPALPTAPPRLESARVERQRPSTVVIALLVVAIAALGFAGFGVWHGVKEWRADDVAASRKAATDAAETAAETIFTYQYNKLDEHLRESQKLMTPTFAKKFKSVSPALSALAPQRKIRVKAVVRNAAPIECGDTCSPDKATVLMFIDQARVADNVDKPTVFGNRIQLSMVERDGSWLVNNIKAL